MSLCNGCIHKTVCRKTVCDGDLGYGYFECPHFLNTADVVPREEVERLKNRIEILEALCKTNDRVGDDLIKARNEIDRIKTETSMEIFEEISAIIQRNTEHAFRNGFLRVSGYNCKQIVRLIYEFKEKYTEDDNGKRTDR